MFHFKCKTLASAMLMGVGKWRLNRAVAPNLDFSKKKNYVYILYALTTSGIEGIEEWCDCLTW